MSKSITPTSFFLLYVLLGVRNIEKTIMKSLSFEQMEDVNCGTAADAVACLGGIAGYAVLFACVTNPVTIWAAVAVIADWTASGLATGVGCGRWISSAR